MKLLTELDRSALAAYCGAYALWAEATEAIQKYGTMVKSSSGYPQQSPYVAVANRQAEIMMRIASQLVFGVLRRLLADELGSTFGMEGFDAFAEIIGLAQPAVAVTLKLDRNAERCILCIVEEFLGRALRKR